ncbi:MAG: hypothetical protein U1G07_14070 [Verrucomicrobiota bacterium]
MVCRVLGLSAAVGQLIIRRKWVLACCRKDGKTHVYYSLCQSERVGRDRTTQRRLLNLGELNSTQVDQWQRSIHVREENGQSRQMRLLTDRDGATPQGKATPGVAEYAEVLLSSFELRRPRRVGDCWLGCRLWEELIQ